MATKVANFLVTGRGVVTRSTSGKLSCKSAFNKQCKYTTMKCGKLDWSKTFMWFLFIWTALHVKMYILNKTLPVLYIGIGRQKIKRELHNLYLFCQVCQKS